MMKLDINNANLAVRVCTPDDEPTIPENLAQATLALLALHKANGDLAWVADMCHDMESCKYGVSDLVAPGYGDPLENAKVAHDNRD